MNLTETANPIDEAGTLHQVASNLFYGWGYNFYRDENKLRADDLLVRGKISDLIAEARAHVAAIEKAYRREHLPPPTREHPYPDPAAVAMARKVSDFSQDLETLETHIRNASVSEMDRVNQRHRNEKATLQRLVVADGELVDAVLYLKEVFLSCTSVEALEAVGVRDASQHVQATWEARQAVLSPVSMPIRSGESV